MKICLDKWVHYKGLHANKLTLKHHRVFLNMLKQKIYKEETKNLNWRDELTYKCQYFFNPQGHLPPSKRLNELQAKVAKFKKEYDDKVKTIMSTEMSDDEKQAKIETLKQTCQDQQQAAAVNHNSRTQKIQLSQSELNDNIKHSETYFGRIKEFMSEHREMIISVAIIVFHVAIKVISYTLHAAAATATGGGSLVVSIPKIISDLGDLIGYMRTIKEFIYTLKFEETDRLMEAIENYETTNGKHIQEKLFDMRDVVKSGIIHGIFGIFTTLAGILGD